MPGGEIDKTGVSWRPDEGMTILWILRARRNFTFTEPGDGWARVPGTRFGETAQACVCACVCSKPCYHPHSTHEDLGTQMLQDLSNISLLAELELKLSTLDSKSCVLTGFRRGLAGAANKQASKQTVGDTNPWILGWKEPICRNLRNRELSLHPPLTLTLR